MEAEVDWEEELEVVTTAGWLSVWFQVPCFSSEPDVVFGVDYSCGWRRSCGIKELRSQVIGQMIYSNISVIRDNGRTSVS